MLQDSKERGPMEASEDYESSGIIILDFFYSDSPPSLLESYDAPKLWPPRLKGAS